MQKHRAQSEKDQRHSHPQWTALSSQHFIAYVMVSAPVKWQASRGSWKHKQQEKKSYRYRQLYPFSLAVHGGFSLSSHENKYKAKSPWLTDHSNKFITVPSFGIAAYHHFLTSVRNTSAYRHREELWEQKSSPPGNKPGVQILGMKSSSPSFLQGPFYNTAVVLSDI